jgi:gliding motility-associated-like protein
MKLPITFICLLFLCASFAQKEANVWHFGTGYSLDFNSGVPVQIPGSPMFTFEGSTSYCDENGNLLFYSNGGGRIPASGQDGGKIWNKNNQVMYDMQGIEGGGWSAAQSSVIVPAPGEPDVYYLFTMEELEHYIDATPAVLAAEPNGRGFRYFKIDMSLNGGLGDVVVADVPLYDYSFEGLCAIRHANETDYWILINQDTTGIGVYSVTQSGVQLAGVYPTPISNSGSIIKSSPFPFVQGQTCCNKVMTQVGLFDFDLTTGVLTLDTDLGGAALNSFEFSPNGFYLYASIFDPLSSSSQLVQYDVLLANQTGQNLTTTSQVIEQNFDGYYMQLAPDGKIYFTEQNIDFISGEISTQLGTINCPNTGTPTVSSGIFSYPSDGQNSFGFFSLPNFPSWIFYNSYEAQIQFGPDTLYLCLGDTLQLNAGEGTSWSWGGDAATNTGQFYTVTSPGIYSATVNGPCGSGSDQIVVLPCETSSPCDDFNLGDGITACLNDTIQLSADLSGFQNITNLEWTGSGIFLPSNAVANPLYVPAASEYNAGLTSISLNVSLASTSSVPSGFLAYDHASEDLLFYINSADGSIDSIQQNTGKDWTAMGFRSADCLLYGLSNIVTAPMLSSIDLETGVVNDIFSYPNHQFYAGEYDNTNDVFYAVGMSEINSGELLDQLLYSINPVTGALDTIGNLNLPAIDGFFYTPDDGINGLAYDPTLNALFGITDNGKLYQINPSTAAIAFIGNTASGMRGLAYDEIQNTLWAISPSATLVEIDKQTGAQLSTVLCQESFGVVTSLTFVSGTCGEANTCSDQLQIAFENCDSDDNNDNAVEFDFSFPNVITANGDGFNDLFEIENLPENTEVIILNRWGNVVFSSSNYQNNWDGKDISGRDLLEGVYTYKYTTETGTIGHGFVHLIR